MGAGRCIPLTMLVEVFVFLFAYVCMYSFS